MSDLGTRLAAFFGQPVTTVRPLGGGTFGRPYAITLADGQDLFVKVADGGPAPRPESRGARWTAYLPDDDAPLTMFTSEARGLLRLDTAADEGGAAVPRLVTAYADVLVTALVDPHPPTRDAATAFGTALARTHRFGSPNFGSSTPVYLASEVLPEGTDADWPTFFAERRLRPFLDRAEAAGGIWDRDADDVRRVIDRLPALAGPAELPALLHGDLWSGNVLWTAASATMIDPACHGGHRETDLAMLALFGLPHLETVLGAYDAEFPLAAGWRDRVALHQVFPLLVHALLFGGSYGAATGEAARRALSR